MMNDIVIYAMASLAALSALFVLFTKNILYAAFALVLTFLAIAILYIVAGAEFVGVTQIMIYVGGIIVLVIFGVMLTSSKPGRVPMAGHNKLIGGLIASLVFGLFVYAIWQMNLPALPRDTTHINEVGKGLLTTYLLPFEIAAVLLLLALIGASVIASQTLKKRV